MKRSSFYYCCVVLSIYCSCSRNTSWQWWLFKDHDDGSGNGQLRRVCNKEHSLPFRLLCFLRYDRYPPLRAPPLSPRIDRAAPYLLASRKRQIFVVLRHEVYPKFVARVMERSRQHVPPVAAAAAAETRWLAKMTKRIGISGSSSPAESTTAPTENQRVSWSESDEVSKAVRAELAKCYY